MKSVTLFLSLLITGCATLAEPQSTEVKYKPLPVPNNVRVTSSEPRQIVWSGLTAKEQRLATHLLRAATAGKPIIYLQNHRHGLLVKRMLENALSARNLARTKAELGAGYIEFLNYAAKFTDQSGPYATSNRKYVLSVVTPDQIATLFRRHTRGASAQDVQEAVRLLTDSEYEVISQPEDASGAGLETAGGNNYEKGLTGQQVADAMKAGLNSNLNCYIKRDAKGAIVCDVQALNNPHLNPVVRKAMTTIVKELNLALPFASSQHQSNQIRHLITYLQTGDTEEFRQMNIEWVKDGTSSKVDFMMGYVEVYQDYLNQIGAWESYVQIVDPKTTQLSIALAKNAQAFENNMPYGVYKKTFPADYAPPALMVYYFQELSAFRSGGYNLPNFDDIRRDVGAKNVIRLDLPGLDKNPKTLEVRHQMFQEFGLASKVDESVNNWTKARQALVLLHEIIGHGSGTYDTTKYGPKEDPVGALGALGSALEEQRADLAALVFAADPILVKVGFYTDAKEATLVRNVMYDTYLVTFLQGTSKQRSLSEAHQRGHWVLINKLIERNAIKRVSRDGVSPVTDENFVWAVTDYELYHQVCSDLLAEMQKIKAERDEAGLKTLFEKYAPLDAIELPYFQAVIARGAKLEINSGSIEQPWILNANKIQPLGDNTSLEGIAPYFGK